MSALHVSPKVQAVASTALKGVVVSMVFVWTLLFVFGAAGAGLASVTTIIDKLITVFGGDFLLFFFTVGIGLAFASPIIKRWGVEIGLVTPVTELFHKGVKRLVNSISEP